MYYINTNQGIYMTDNNSDNIMKNESNDIHPFLDKNIIHNLSPKTEETPIPTKKKSSLKRNSIISLAVLTLLAAPISVGAFIAHESGYNLIANNMFGLKTQEVVAKQSINFKKLENSFQIPNDYPEIIPGERIVYYFPSPTKNEKTIERLDTNGCSWQVVVNSQEGEKIYPVILKNGLQKCNDAGAGLDPYKARMIGDNYPRIKGSNIKVVEILDAQTGDSMMPRTLVNTLNRSEVIAAKKLKDPNYSDPLLPKLNENGKQIPIPVKNKAPVKKAANTATVRKIQPPKIPVGVVPTFDPRNPNVITNVTPQRERAPQRQYQPSYQPDINDELVPINPRVNREEEFESISSPRTRTSDLRPITQSDSPGNNRLNGVKPIERNNTPN